MAIGRSVPTDDDGTGLVGTIWDAAYLNSAIYDRVDALVADWTPITFSAGNFTATAGTWTVASGDVVVNRYQVINKTLFWNCVLQTTTVSTTPVGLKILIPGGFSAGAAAQYNRAVYVSDNGTVRECLITAADATHIQVYRLDAGNFAASTDNTSVIINLMLELA